MAGKTKKNAKLAHNKAQVADEVAASHLVIITGKGHLVEKQIDMVTVCGQRRVGWRYGVKDEVTCEYCNGTKSIVPPGQFEVEEVLEELGAYVPASSLDE